LWNLSAGITGAEVKVIITSLLAEVKFSLQKKLRNLYKIKKKAPGKGAGILAAGLAEKRL
jgi:hypothetical protein